MAKAIFRNARILLGGHDVSAHVTRLQIAADIGEFYTVELDLIDGDWLEIVRTVHTGSNFPSVTVVVKVHGTDISSHVFQCDRIVEAGDQRFDTVRLYLHASSEVLSINGTTPWEEK